MKEILKQLKELDFDLHERRMAIEKMGEIEFTVKAGGGEYRFILESEAMDILKDELASDIYALGFFNAWFITDIIDLPTDAIKKAQAGGHFELLGELMLKHIDEVAVNYVRHDGLGHHFGIYDGNEYEVGQYLVFRTN